MNAAESQRRLCAAIGYEFRDAGLLRRGLTHRSAGAANYERLEFLGDGLLNFVVGEALFQARPDCEEGDLSRLRASLVREDSLAAVAERLQLGDALVLGGGVRKSGGFRRASILADALEALLGAVYLDGGFVAAREVCLRVLAPALSALPEPAGLKDPKTRLQEWLQGRGRPIPVYEIGSARGEAHHPQFTVACRLADTGDATEGEAETRKAAEQAAAAKMLQRLEAHA